MEQRESEHKGTGQGQQAPVTAAEVVWYQRWKDAESENTRLRRNGTWAMNERDSALNAMEASDEENVRLRNALRRIADLSLPYRDTANRARDIARKALEL